MYDVHLPFALHWNQQKYSKGLIEVLLKSLVRNLLTVGKFSRLL